MQLTRRDLLRLGLAAGILPSTAALAAALDAKTGAAPDLSNNKGVVLTFLHTNDPHGRVLQSETAGLARLAPLIRGIRADMPNTLLLEAGDLIHGTPEEREFEGKPIISAMNALGYDAATAGNHEFDFGQRITRQAMKMANFPMLSANVLDEKTGKPWGDLKPYIIKEVNGVRVAIFGLTTMDTVKIQFPRTLEGIKFADPVETARKLVPMLREKERADVVVFLSHLGYKPDCALAEAISGIDLILGGHSHTRLAKQVWVNGTLIMQTGYHCRALGRADIFVERGADGRARLTINGQNNHWWGQDGVAAPLGKAYPTGPLIEPTDITPSDTAVTAAYKPYRDQITKRDAEVLTTAVAPWPATGAKLQEIPLGTLLAEAVRAKFKTDAAFVPSGAVANGFKTGPISVLDAMNTIGGYTRQHVVTVRASGAQLRAMHDRNAACEMQTAGLGLVDGVLQINGAPLRDEAFYKVGAAAYLIQSELMGKDGVTIIDDNPETPTTREAIVEYLRGHKPI